MADESYEFFLTSVFENFLNTMENKSLLLNNSKEIISRIKFIQLPEDIFTLFLSKLKLDSKKQVENIYSEYIEIEK